MNKVITGENRFCGPAVLSILTSKSVDACADAISSVRGNIGRPVTSVDFDFLIAAARKLRVEIKDVDVHGYSLFSKLTNLVDSPGVYLIGLPKHVACVEVKEDKSIYFNDNHTKTEIKAGGSARLMQKVDKIFKAIPLAPPELIESHIRFERIANVICIKKDMTYRDERDNQIQSVGSFKYHSHVEVREIANKLLKWIDKDG